MVFSEYAKQCMLLLHNEGHSLRTNLLRRCQLPGHSQSEQGEAGRVGTGQHTVSVKKKLKYVRCGTVTVLCWCGRSTLFVHSWCGLGALLVRSWYALGMLMVRSWCALGTLMVRSRVQLTVPTMCKAGYKAITYSPVTTY